MRVEQQQLNYLRDCMNKCDEAHIALPEASWLLPWSMLV